MSDQQDYFELFDQLPANVKEVLEPYNEPQMSYEECAELVHKLEEIGWTCEYGLDATPFNLHPIK